MTEQPTDRWSLAAWSLLVLGIAAALLVPALYNRFPLFFPDTPAYLSVGYGHYWTLDRAGFYGLALKPLLTTIDPVAALWVAVGLQGLLIAGVLLLAVRRIAPEVRPLAIILPMLAIILLTSLPWHVSQLMPDAMTGGLVLLVWLAASRAIGAPGTALLWLGSGLLALLHYTHLVLFAVTAAATLALCQAPLRDIARRAVAALVVLAAVVGAYVTVNGVYFGRWSIAPMSPLFLFARLNEDGLAPRWLDRHCGRDAPVELCDVRASLPRDSQTLLWGGPASPLTQPIHHHIGQPESWRWIGMLRQASFGSIRDEPLTFARYSAVGGARQFAHFESLDDECPDRCVDGIKGLIAFQQSLAAPLEQSRQLRGQINKPLVRRVTSAAALAGLLLSLPMLAAAIRRRDRVVLSLLGAILFALIANAAMTGALSDVHDRYQSRLVWLAPFAILWIAIRWGSIRPAPGGDK